MTSDQKFHFYQISSCEGQFLDTPWAPLRHYQDKMSSHYLRGSLNQGNKLIDISNFIYLMIMIITRMMTSNPKQVSRISQSGSSVGHLQYVSDGSFSGLTGSSGGGRQQCQNVRHCSCFTVALPSFSLISLKSERWVIHLLLGHVSPFTIPLFLSPPLCSFSPRGQIIGLRELCAHVRTWEGLFTLVSFSFLLVHPHRY